MLIGSKTELAAGQTYSAVGNSDSGMFNGAVGANCKLNDVIMIIIVAKTIAKTIVFFIEFPYVIIFIISQYTIELQF